MPINTIFFIVTSNTEHDFWYAVYEMEIESIGIDISVLWWMLVSWLSWSCWSIWPHSLYLQVHYFDNDFLSHGGVMDSGRVEFEFQPGSLHSLTC